MYPLASQPNGKHLAFLFFKKDKESKEKWKCNVFKEIISEKSGYNNMCNHIRPLRNDCIEEQQQTSSECKRDTFNFLLFSSKPVTATARFECVVHTLLLFSFVDIPVFRKYFEYSSMRQNALMRYLLTLTERDKKKITKLFPDCIALNFDFWSCDSTNFIGVFAICLSESSDGFTMVLSRIFSMDNETTKDASEHHKILSVVLSVFE